MELLREVSLLIHIQLTEVAFTATTSYTNLAAGTYAVEVRDANSCDFSTSAPVSNTGGPTAIATTVVMQHVELPTDQLLLEPLQEVLLLIHIQLMEVRSPEQQAIPTLLQALTR